MTQEWARHHYPQALERDTPTGMPPMEVAMMETLPVLFIVTSLILIITPGQDMLLVMSRSIAQGSKAGVATAAGVSTGLLGHTALATLGLGAVLSASEMLFVAIELR